jgi:hypothetical protein
MKSHAMTGFTQQVPTTTRLGRAPLHLNFKVSPLEGTSYQGVRNIFRRNILVTFLEHFGKSSVGFFPLGSSQKTGRKPWLQRKVRRRCLHIPRGLLGRFPGAWTLAMEGQVDVDAENLPCHRDRRPIVFPSAALAAAHPLDSGTRPEYRTLEASLGHHTLQPGNEQSALRGSRVGAAK